MLSDTRIMLEKAINRLHEAKANEMNEETKHEIQRIIFTIQHLIDGDK